MAFVPGLLPTKLGSLYSGVQTAKTLSKYNEVSQRVRDYIKTEKPKLHKLLAFMEEKRLENLEKKNNN